jgi:FkbH-like protein
LKCFEAPAVTTEDATRTKMYAAERSRTELLERIGSVDSWLKSLAIRVEVQEVGNSNLNRALQLLNKTNQMNLATRRLNELEFHEWLATGARKSWCFRVSDRLGDSGIAGLLSIEHVGEVAEIRDFLLSCRVIGRKVEETMLHFAIDYARCKGLREVRAKYEPTARNIPCLEFLKRAGFQRLGDHVFIWYAREYYPVPEAVECSKKMGER